MLPVLLLFFLGELEVEFGDSGHQDSDVLISFAHLGLVLSVLRLVVVDVSCGLNAHSFNCLFKLAVSLQQDCMVLFRLVKLFFVVVTHREKLLLCCVLDSHDFFLFEADSTATTAESLRHCLCWLSFVVTRLLSSFKLLFKQCKPISRAQMIKPLLAQLLLELSALSKALNLLLLSL